MKKCIVNLGIILALVFPSMLRAQITAQSFQPEFLSCDDEWNPPYVIANSNCGNITLDYVVIEDGSGCSIYRTVITTILDECDNILTLTQVTEIVDDQAPQFINPPVDIIMNCDAQLPPVASVQAIDNCDVQVDLGYEELTYDEGCQHTILRIFTAADDCGNSVYHIQNITVVDVDAPQIEIEDVVYSPNEIPDPELLATISDNCSEAAVSFDVIGPEPDPVYGAQYLYVYTAVDDCGNIAYKFHEVYTCDRTTIMISNMQGQSLSGLSYTISNNAGQIVASGSAGNSFFYEDATCLGAGCYTVEVQNPLNYPISWTVSGALMTYTSTPGVTSTNFSVGASCSGLGCTDENNCNYDPFASIYDQAACDQPCIFFNFEYNEPMFELDWEFALANAFGTPIAQYQLPAGGVVNLEPFTTYTLVMSSNTPNGWNGGLLTFENPNWNWSFEATLTSQGTEIITFSTGGAGCTDPAACNYNPQATISDGGCLNQFGCTDPAASNFDPAANCDDESCVYIVNDEKEGAVMLQVNSGGVCQFVSEGDLSLATTSSNALSEVVTGEDMWYAFEAQERGVSIEVVSPDVNLVIELQSANGLIIDSENALNAAGNETLHYGNLVEGNTYYIVLRNYNSTISTGRFVICVKELRSSGCAANNSAVLQMCGKFRAKNVQADFYNFKFLSNTTNEIYSLFNAPRVIDIDDITGILPGDTYRIVVEAGYYRLNGSGNEEEVIVAPIESCEKEIAPNTLIALAILDNCDHAGSVPLNRTVKSEPIICGAVDYEWEFTNQNGNQPTILHLRGDSKRNLKLNTVNGLLTWNVYDVRVRPVYADGIYGEFGNVECLRIAGNRSMTLEEAENTADDLLVYPNPGNGNSLSIDVSDQEIENYTLEIYDITGKLVYTAVHPSSENGIIQVQFTVRPESGTYLIKLIGREESRSTLWIVQ